MICEICKKNQASFYRLVPSLGKQAPICAACMSRLSASTGFSGGFLNEFGLHSGLDLIQKQINKFQPSFANEIEDFYADRRTMGSVVCSNCGFEFRQYAETGRFGCSKCYDVFRGKIVPIVTSIHGCARHNGSRPRSTL